MRTTPTNTESPEQGAVSGGKAWCILIFFIALIPRVINLDNPGLTWDEPGYIWAGKAYIENVLNHQLDAWAWQPNWEHPPLAKYLMGLGAYVLEPFGVSEVAAARVPNAILGALTCVVIFLLLKEAYTEWVAVLGALILSFLPRFFADTRFAALDAPEAAFATFSIYAFWRGVKSDAWMAASAVFLGMAFSVKISAISLPLIFLTWLIVTYRGEPVGKVRILKFFILYPLLTVVIFVSLWPLLWVRPEHFLTFLEFHFRHFNIPVYYLGTVYPNGPWHYPFVMTIVTTPTYVVIAATFGALFAVKNLFTAKDKMAVLLLMWLLVSLLRGSISYGYDGVRLFLDALPALASLAAIATAWLVALLRRLFNPSIGKLKAVFIVLALVAVVSGVYGCVVTYPYETSYYNEVLMATGGTRYFESTYWGEVYKEVVEWLETNAPSSKVVVPIAYHLPQYYAQTVTIIPDFYSVFGDRSVRFAFQAREGFYSWSLMIGYFIDNLEPEYTIRVDGLTVAYVYNLEDYYTSYARTKAAADLLELSHTLTVGRAVAIDLTNYANRGFSDDTPDDGKGGWADEGTNDLREFPRGNIRYQLVSNLLGNDIQISFNVPSHGNSCIVLRSQHKAIFPPKVERIAVNVGNISGLVFLQACVQSGLEGETIARYIVRYSDGTTTEIPVIYGENVRDWWHDPTPMEGAVPAWVGSNPVHRPVTIYMRPWINPYPSKHLESIDFASEQTGGTPILIAVTAIYTV